MKRVLAGVVAVLAAGCFQPKTCTDDAQCSAGRCDTSTGTGICVQGDGGMGGGTGGGGGSGGGVGGGTGGGGTGGGAAYCADAGLGCEEWEECQPTLDGGRCVSADYQVRWVAPDAGAVFNAASVPAQVAVTKADGGTVSLMAVPVVGAGAFSGANGVYMGSLPLTAPDGDKTFTAGWPAFASDDLTVRYDTTPPTVSVSVEPRPASLGDADPVSPAAWKKDEVATVQVTVTDGPPAQASQVRLPWGGAVSAATCSGSCSGNCRCFALDVSGTDIRGMRDTATFTVAGVADEAGNVAPDYDAGVEVTRYRWVRTMDLASAADSLLSVAVSPTGLVLWGGSNAPAGQARLRALHPDGGLAWTALDAGLVTAGPVAGTTNVWVATQGATTSQLDSVSLAGGVVASPGQCIAANTFTGDLALSFVGGMDVPLGVRAGEVQGPSSGNCRSVPLPDAGDTSAPTLVVQSDGGSTEAFVTAQGDGKLWKQSLRAATWTDNGSATTPSGTQPRGLFFDGMGRVGGGGGGVAGNGAVFVTSATGPLSGTISTSVTAANAGAPVLGNGFVLWGNTTGGLVKATYASGAFGTPGTPQPTGLGNLQSSMPLLGEGDLVYLVGPTGQLSVRRSDTLAELWSANLGSSTAVSQLALDVLRTGGARDCNRRLGVLYVVTKSGATATLRAVLVDSRGLQANAPWPKYQRDNGNRGNISQPFADWTCP